MASQIFHFSSPKSPSPKLHISTGQLPAYIDPSQPPTKKAPWRAIYDSPFIHTVHLIMPEELYDLIWHKLEPSLVLFDYYKVILKLEDVLTGDFFTEYIKKGNILMLSEGDASSGDTIISLRTGVMRIDMPHTVYERSGLPNGISIPSGGQKHTKSRFRVEYDLRAPSMLKGKKGFDRLLYAAKNTPGLSEGRCWLFQNLTTTETDSDKKPIATHHPTVVRGEVSTTDLKEVMVPSAISSSLRNVSLDAMVTEEDFFELTEWFDLVKVESPRIRSGDVVDPFICQYVLPGNTEEVEIQNVRKLSWEGLIESAWIAKLLNEMIRQTRLIDAAHWMYLSATTHPTEAAGQIDGYTILFQPSRVEENNTEDAMEVDSSTGNISTLKRQGEARQGLQEFTQFQFIDTLTA